MVVDDNEASRHGTIDREKSWSIANNNHVAQKSGCLRIYSNKSLYFITNDLLFSVIQLFTAGKHGG